MKSTINSDKRAELAVWRRTAAYSLVLTQPIKRQDLGSAPDVLDALTLEWLGYCQSIGGLKLGNRDSE
jgi:hypothetical protein